MQNLSYDMAGGEEKFLQKNLLAPVKLLQKNQLPRYPFHKKMYLPRIHEQQMLYSTTDELAKDHNKINSCPYESLLTKKWTLKMKRYD